MSIECTHDIRKVSTSFEKLRDFRKPKINLPVPMDEHRKPSSSVFVSSPKVVTDSHCHLWTSLCTSGRTCKV